MHTQVRPRAKTETEAAQAGAVAWVAQERTQAGEPGMLRVRRGSQPPAGYLLTWQEAEHLLAPASSKI